ncbi:MAG: tetratricopeptide repeat protein [Chloroflexi bacterium]|nr:tetratricopeptide repeat protein [Chloroflexota bacterium]
MKIFISSTFQDLQEYRRRVIEGLDRLRLQDVPIEWIAMEAFSASDSKPAELIRRKVADCDVYLGIVGMRYGSIDPETGQSFTEIEYRCAVEQDKARLLFLIDEKKGEIHPADVETDPNGMVRLKQLKDEMKLEHVVAHFDSPGDLADKVNTAIQPFLRDRVSAQDFRERPLDPIPIIPAFIGHQTELARYRDQLERDHFLIIEGMPGVGKTTLGALLAREEQKRGRRVFWIDFDSTVKNNAEIFVWDIAAFLAQDGKTELWDFLQSETDASRRRDKAARFELMLSLLASGEYTLCLNDLHVVLRDEEITFFFGRIQKRFLYRESELPTRFVVMTRQVPAFLGEVAREELSGFDETDARAFLTAQRVELVDADFREMYRQVEGNPQFLRLSIAGLLAHKNDPVAIGKFIQGLAGQRNIRDYLMKEIYGTLNDSEKRVLDALAIFQIPVAYQAVEEVLAEENVKGITRVLDGLTDRHIVYARALEQIGLHPLVREYCERNLDRDAHTRLNGKAAAYFISRRDYVMAAHHYRNARDYENAAQILIEHESELISAGRVDSMLEQLGVLTREQLSQDNWLKVCRVRGKSNHVRSRFDEAVENYEKVLEIGQAAQNDSLIADAHLGIGWAHFRRGDYRAASEHLEKAIEFGKAARDNLLVARAEMRLGAVYLDSGDLDRAFASSNRSLETFGRANISDDVADALGNLGRIYHARGDWENAAQHYMQAIQIYEKLGNRNRMTIGYNNLGDVYREQGDFQSAIRCLEKSAQLAASIGNDFALAETSSTLAETLLGLGDPHRALEYAMRALQIAQSVEAKQHEGVVYRELGDIRAALGERKQARAQYENALKISESVGNQSDLANLYLNFGKFLLSEADPDAQARGKEFLKRARDLFRQIGARREEEKISTILADN